MEYINNLYYSNGKRVTKIEKKTVDAQGNVNVEVTEESGDGYSNQSISNGRNLNSSK